MKLAALQYRPPHGQPSVARKELRAMLAKAAGADLVVCPEMATTGYVFDSANEIAPHAEPADGPTFAMLRDCARELGAWLVCGIAESDAGVLYNSALTVSPAGELITCYRKVLLYEQDETWARAGDRRALVATEKLGVLAPSICMNKTTTTLSYAWRKRICAFLRRLALLSRGHRPSISMMQTTNFGERNHLPPPRWLDGPRHWAVIAQ